MYRYSTVSHKGIYFVTDGLNQYPTDTVRKAERLASQKATKISGLINRAALQFASLLGRLYLPNNARSFHMQKLAGAACQQCERFARVYTSPIVNASTISAIFSANEELAKNVGTMRQIKAVASVAYSHGLVVMITSPINGVLTPSGVTTCRRAGKTVSHAKKAF